MKNPCRDWLHNSGSIYVDNEPRPLWMLPSAVAEWADYIDDLLVLIMQLAHTPTATEDAPSN
jgi:hypothetical protein